LKQKKSLAVSVDHLFAHGHGEYANMLLKSLDDVSCGVNILAVRLIENGESLSGTTNGYCGWTAWEERILIHLSMQPYAATIWKKSVAPDFPAYVPSIFEFTTSPNKRRDKYDSLQSS
jgi:hypothetical protein